MKGLFLLVLMAALAILVPIEAGLCLHIPSILPTLTPLLI
jgi:hypothetical protein